MIVDSSALICIIKNQPEAARCLKALETASQLFISAGNYLEAAIVADSREIKDAFPTLALEQLMTRYAIAIEPVTVSQAELARRAHQLYGRGNASKAKLNYGDCFAYALAREKNEPLLFVGDDFTHTDITPALS
jgi:ribonuclease VapC